MTGDGQERTEPATQRRLEEAAARGQVAYSRELTAAVLLLVVLGALRLRGGDVSDGLFAAFRATLSLEGFRELTRDGIGPILAGHHHVVVGLVLPLLLVVLAGVALAGFLQVGFAVNLKRIEAQWDRLNPLNGVRKLLSTRSAISIGFSILKLAVVAAVAWPVILGIARDAGGLASADLPTLARMFTEAVFTIGFRVGAILLVLAVADVLWQRWRHAKDLMMTRDEVQEDRKSGEGDPRIRGRIRQVQRDMARARLARDVKKATVVVRNPVHFAVALRYRTGQDTAPRLVAKGRNLIALRIIQLAEKHGVPVRTDPPLARRIYHTVRVGRTIPEELFAAVAKVLAWVYRRKGRGPGAAPAPAETEAG